MIMDVFLGQPRRRAWELRLEEGERGAVDGRIRTRAAEEQTMIGVEWQREQRDPQPGRMEVVGR